MLRTFRTADLPAYYDLMIGQFPNENAILGWRQAEFFRIVKRLDRFPLNVVLGLMSAVGRPLFRFWVIEVDGQFAASALETFRTPSAYVGSVVVDPKFRRRGLAKQVLEACSAAARKRGMEFVTLDVLDGNDPALALYRSLGYTSVGHGAHYRWTPDAVALGPTASPRVRPFRKADRHAIAAFAAASVSEARQRVHPIEANDFLVAPAVVRALDSTSEAWVVDAGTGPTAWVRASVSPATEAAHLSAPFLAPSADPADVRGLIATAVRWTREKGAPRVVTEVWDDNVAGAAALRAAGFAPAYGVQTLALAAGRA